MILDVPLAQQEGRGGATVAKSGIAGFTNGTVVNVIKADLVQRLNDEQTAINNDTSYQFYGSTYNGTTWS